MMAMAAVCGGPEGDVIDDDEDRQIARAFADGDAAALKQIYDRWSRLVYTVALRSLGDQSEAEDVTQGTFVSAWKGRESYDEARASLSTWLITIARRRIADAHRVRAHSARVRGALRRSLQRMRTRLEGNRVAY